MPIKVKNIKIDEITFDKKHFKDFDKCVEYINLIEPNYKKYLPSRPQHHIEFEIADTNADFANAIRRFLIDEISVFSMHVDEADITTDDKFILSDFLKKNIELVPFSQRISDTDLSDLKLSLHVENKTDDIMTVYTRDIVVNKKNNVVDNEKYFSTNIPIIQLRSDKTLDIKNISTTTGYGKHDSGKFCLLANISYEILDIEPSVECKYSKTGESSLNSTPRHFKIGFKTHRNIEPKKVMILCCDTLTVRLENILKELSNIANTTKVHFSNLIELETKGDVSLYHFKNEYWTISNIIARYCYLVFNDIKFVCSCIIHPSTEESIVKIRHPDSGKILSNAIKSILDDVAILKKAFN